AVEIFSLEFVIAIGGGGFCRWGAADHHHQGKSCKCKRVFFHGGISLRSKIISLLCQHTGERGQELRATVANSDHVVVENSRKHFRFGSVYTFVAEAESVFESETVLVQIRTQNPTLI